MPDLQRQAIVLREWRGFTYKEIAAELELSDAAVETLIFRARRSLASRLENPNAHSTKRSKAFALNFAPFASTFKSVFGLGGAAKVTAVAATVAALGIGVGLTGDTPTVSPATPNLAQGGVRFQRDVAPAGWKPTKSTKPTKERKHKNHSSSSPALPGTSAGGDSGSSTSAPTVAAVKEQATSTLATATDLLDTAADEANELVGTASDALDPALPPLSDLPQVEATP
jgi:hypothetical protein